jgi:iron-sulfur cluster protein
VSKSREAKAARIRELMRTEGETVAQNLRGFNQARYAATAELDDYETLKREARAIKEDAIEHLPELLDQLRAAVTENGGTVYVADDAADANRYIEEVVAENAATSEDGGRVVKSKSMTTEELEVNDHLHAAGHHVVETDLGEFVLQVADETPSHIVGPAVHKSREAIADLFNARFDPPEELETAEELVGFARDHLLDEIREADVGMTGANFVVSETGTLALVTSEGNARKCAVTPKTHVAVAGVEKVIPTVEALQPFAELIGRSGTGQSITSYFSLLTPPVTSPVPNFTHPDEPLRAGDPADREFHLVLVDNGRLSMRDDDQLRETLYCIRCGACSNSCGNFQSVGGHAFGGETYSGGIATGWEAGIEGLDTAAEFNDLCTGCTRCVPACPVEIDIPWINTVVRDRVNHGADADRFDWLVDGLTPDAESAAGMALDKRLFGNIDTLAKWGSATAPVSNWLASRAPARALLERVVGVDRRRPLPEFQRETFVDWFADRGPQVSREEAARTAVVYADTFTNHVGVERGRAAVRTLEALDVHVRVPAVPDSGRPPLSQGMVATAERSARAVHGALSPYLDDGFDVVVLEPSDLAMFEREYERFLPEPAFEALSEQGYDVMEYVFGLLANEGDPTRLRGPNESGVIEVAYHPHCQGRTIGVSVYASAVLSDLGYDVVETETECCGMAGSFGYKQAYYDLSMDVGEPIREQVAGTDRTVVASGTSCLDHLGDLLGRETTHPIELVAPAN